MTSVIKDPVIEFKDFWWKYEGSADWILKNINLKIKTGEFVAITGPSGAGKTTLISCLNGLIPHSNVGEIQGSVNVAGLDVFQHPVRELAQKVGMLFQDPECGFIGMNVEDDIVFGPENLKVPREEIARRLNWVLDIIKMEEYRKKSPIDLSGGQKQRVAIASALAMLPEVLVLDEPTSELDPIGKSEIFQVISELRKLKDITIILVEHETEEIVKYADRILLLKDGEIKLEGTPVDFFCDVPLVKGMGVPPPQVVELNYLLTQEGILKPPFPVTFEKATKYISAYLKNKSRSKIDYNRSNQIKHRMGKRGKVIIEVKGLHFKYPDDTYAVRGVDLEIFQKESVGIIGHNGSGKTTLVKHFNGLLKPTEGEVIIDGLNTKETSVAELAKKVGYVFQNPDHQISQTTVMKEVAFGPKQLDLDEEEIEKRVGNSLKQVGLGDVDLEESPLFLSKGERQRLAVASVLSMRPEILIVDEPTTGQDYLQRREIMDMISQLNREGQTTLFISHDMELIAEYTDRVIIINEGEILLEGSPENVFSEIDILKKSFIRPPQITRFADRLQKYGVPSGILTVDEMKRVFTRYLS